MTVISIIPENQSAGETVWHAIAGNKESAGKTAGQALDALTSQLDWETTGALVIVRQMRPDRFFSSEQQKRLTDLMSRWRTARDGCSQLPASEQSELASLVEAEVKGAGERAAEELGDMKL